MQKIGIEELKQIGFKVLKEVDSICKQNGFRYSLMAGTLLGAVRHGGFIPWDDDIDIMMPRPDYEKFIEYCKNNKDKLGFKMVCNETEASYGYLFGKACDKNSVIVEEYTNPKNIEMGVYVDIFPADGLGDTYDEAIKNFKSTSFLRELLVARNWKRFFRSRTRSWKYEPIRFAFFILSRFVSQGFLVRQLKKKLTRIKFDDAKYVGVVCGAYRTKEIVEHKLYSEFSDIMFEGESFCAIKDRDAYLSGIYGNYMQLPKEEKRVTHHMFKAYIKTDDKDAM